MSSTSQTLTISAVDEAANQLNALTVERKEPICMPMQVQESQPVVVHQQPQAGARPQANCNSITIELQRFARSRIRADPEAMQRVAAEIKTNIEDTAMMQDEYDELHTELELLGAAVMIDLNPERGSGFHNFRVARDACAATLASARQELNNLFEKNQRYQANEARILEIEPRFIHVKQELAKRAIASHRVVNSNRIDAQRRATGIKRRRTQGGNPVDYYINPDVAFRNFNNYFAHRRDRDDPDGAGIRV
jgi:hypothetical protein